jgi:two-component system OmpR family sensor kinase
MTIPGGIRAKLALALLLIVGGALFAAYVVVVPSLDRRLVDAKLDQIESNSELVAIAFSSRQFTSSQQLDSYIRNAGVVYDSRIVLFNVLGPPLVLTTVADSSPAATDDVQEDEVALEAARTGATSSGRVTRGDGQYAEAAVPLLNGGVLLFSASLADHVATVRLVERRLIFATGVALAIAGSLGLLVAAFHARRIRRLQQAAERIAEGDFADPIVDEGNDELGQLASSFDRMRVQLAQLDSARKEFVANASHELRTPLFSLGGFLELMDDEELDDETRRTFLATTRAQVDRLARLATDLLDLSRVDAGRLRVEREEVSLTEAARWLVEELQAVAEASGHRLTAVAAEDVWAVADEDRVLQIGRALVVNALTHTPGGCRVVLSARRVGVRSVLTVADDGPGIPIDDARRIFERFYRVEGGQASGSGLGLAIAKELAECMGGGVTVESVPGRTVFTLDLPGEGAVARQADLVLAR